MGGNGWDKQSTKVGARRPDLTPRAPTPIRRYPRSFREACRARPVLFAAAVSPAATPLSMPRPLDSPAPSALPPPTRRPALPGGPPAALGLVTRRGGLHRRQPRRGAAHARAGSGRGRQLRHRLPRQRRRAPAAPRSRHATRFVHRGRLPATSPCAGGLRGRARSCCTQAALGSVPRSLADPLATHAANVDGFPQRARRRARRRRAARRLRHVELGLRRPIRGCPRSRTRSAGRSRPTRSTKRTTSSTPHVFAQLLRARDDRPALLQRVRAAAGSDGAYAAVIPTLGRARCCAASRACIFGDGETSRDFCYVENVVQANLLAATTPRASVAGEVFNVARRAAHDAQRTLRPPPRRARVPCGRGVAGAAPEYRPARRRRAPLPRRHLEGRRAPGLRAHPHTPRRPRRNPRLVRRPGRRLVRPLTFSPIHAGSFFQPQSDPARPHRQPRGRGRHRWDGLRGPAARHGVRRRGRARGRLRHLRAPRGRAQPGRELHRRRAVGRRAAPCGRGALPRHHRLCRPRRGGRGLDLRAHAALQDARP